MTRTDQARNIEDIYPLSPMQQGLLFESLNDRGDRGRAYTVQSQFEISGPLDTELFRRSWQQVAARHPVLRSAFVYENVSRPVQVVLRDRGIPFRLMKAGGEGEPSTADLAAEDLRKGFDLQKDPLMRITLVKTGPLRHHMIWTNHHLVLDGWCLAIIERDLFAFYRAGREGRAPVLPPLRPFSEYIAWLQRQDAGRSLGYWENYLEGYPGLSPVAALGDAPGASGTGITETVLDGERADGLTALSRELGVTLNHLLQTAWGCLLARALDRPDVAFGSIVSGRPAGLEGARDMVGVFINAVPVRLQTGGRTFGELARRRQEEHLASEPHHHRPLAEIANRSGHRPLLDHLFTFENYPLGEEDGPAAGELDIRQVGAHDVTHYPLALKATHTGEIRLQYSWDRALFTAGRIDGIHRSYTALLEELCRRPGLVLDDLAVPGEADWEGIRSLRTPEPAGKYAAGAATDPAADVPGPAPNGRAGAAPDGDRGGRTTAMSPTEEALAEIWREVLERDDIARGDNFFLVGGHSLTAMQAVSRIRKRLHPGASLEHVFAHPTLAEMASFLDAQAGGGRSESLIPRAEKREDYPLSHAQRRLWLQHQLKAGAAYNMPLTYLVREPLDAGLLKEAFRRLIDRHEALRTSFPSPEGEPVQRIHGEAEPLMQVADYRGAPDPLQAARARCEEEAMRPFDLLEAPLLRVLLIRTGEEEYVVQLCIHHIIGDGWSMQVLFEELSLLYEACERGTEADLPPIRVHYRDYTLWQHGRDYPDLEAFWMDYLEGAPDRIHLPADRSPESRTRFAGRHTGAELPAGAVSGLRELATRHGTTLSNVILSLYVLLLSRLSGQKDLCVGISIAGRHDEELERMVGFFVNLLPMRVQVDEEMELDELVASVARSAGQVYARQEYPFDELIRQLNPERMGSRQPLTNVAYGYQNFGDLRLGGEAAPAGRLREVTGFKLEHRTAKFDLTLFARETGPALRLDLEYDSDLFEASSAEGFLQHLQTFCRMAAEAAPSPDNPVSNKPSP